MTREPEDIIAALATPPGAGALAVIRVTGSGSPALVSRIFRGERSPRDLPGFRGTVGWIHGGGAEPIDEVVVWVYRAPRTYTGEDLVEISCHGGRVSSQRVLEALFAAGARPAEPGEFTRRAFLNGRLDLAQAEAVADLIAARGRRAQTYALGQLQGGLSRRVADLDRRLEDVAARITVYLDFEEDVPGKPDAEQLDALLADVEERLGALVETHTSARTAESGLTIVLLGPPNAGKSSLLNALAGMDRALVHEEPGTTRDLVEITVEWDGVPVRIIDTAGLRTGSDPVEQEGMRRAQRTADEADAILWVVDGSAGREDVDPDVLDAYSRAYLVINKQDILRDPAVWVNVYSRQIGPLSARTGSGIRDLVERLRGDLLMNPGGDPDREEVVVTRDRHAAALRRALACVRRGRQAVHTAMELAGADVMQARRELGTITGTDVDRDLLDTIFASFCIGK